MEIANKKRLFGAGGRRIAKWTILVLLIGLYFVLGSWDRQMKHAPHEGYYPEGAVNHLYLPAFPVFWSAFQDSHAGAVLHEELSDVVYDTQLALRKATGIRPTPARWQLWLGPQLLTAEYEGAWGACFHPGLLMRWATAVHQLLGSSQEHPDIYRFRDLYYAPMDGFLVVSTDINYIRAVLEKPAISETNIVAFDSLAFQQKAPEKELTIEVQASQDLFVRGYSRAENYTDGAQPLTALKLPETEDTPLLSLSATSWGDNFAEIGHWLQSIVSHEAVWSVELETLSAFVQPLCSIFEPELLDTLAEAQGRSAHFMIDDMDTTEALPVPVGALALEKDANSNFRDSFYWLSEQLEEIPYYWEIYEGMQYPVWGEKLTLCLSEDEHFTYLTSQEPMMHRLVGNCQPGRRMQGNMALRINWNGLGQALRSHRNLHGRQVRYGDPDSWFSARRLNTYNAILERLGTLEVVGESREGVLEFRGYLARELSS